MSISSPSTVPAKDTAETELLDRIAGLLDQTFDSLDDLATDQQNDKLQTVRQRLRPGKMLRSRLALALRPANEPQLLPTLVRACAATELIHTATLFHDDVIDGADMRRGRPSLWQEVGSTGAILLGDLFFTTAVQMIVETGDSQLTMSFVAKVREVCATEAVHELFLRGQELDLPTGLRIARGKTGAFFAFPASVCGGHDQRLRGVLEEAGYQVGTAYQLMDDFLDEHGDEETIGKTLGTDRKRRKFTLAQSGSNADDLILGQIDQLFLEAVDLLAPWPDRAQGMKAYIADLQSKLAPLYHRPVGSPAAPREQ